MEKFSTEEYGVCEFLGGKGFKFLIPEYQRPYTWDKEQCEELWDDIVNAFYADRDNEYFFGSIVAFESEEAKNTLEIIDGQQRITTFMLLFRALREKFKDESTEEAKSLYKEFGRCIYEFNKTKDKVDPAKRLLESRVATEDDNNILDLILKEEFEVENDNDEIITSKYYENYQLFLNLIEKFKDKNASSWINLCEFIRDQLFILLIECSTQETAMTIFTTLNARGVLLDNTDIIKGEIYRDLRSKNQDTKNFIEQWKKLKTILQEENKRSKATLESIDSVFMQFMLIIKADKKNTDNTKIATLKFFTDAKNPKSFGAKDRWLSKEYTMPFLLNLTNFHLNLDEFLDSESIALKCYDILRTYPNETWKCAISTLVWSLVKQGPEKLNKEQNFKNLIQDNKEIFDEFMKKLLALVLFNFLADNGGKSELLTTILQLNVNLIYGKSKSIKKPDEFPKEFPKTNSKGTKFILLAYSFIYSNFKQKRIFENNTQTLAVLRAKSKGKISPSSINNKNSAKNLLARNGQIEHILAINAIRKASEKEEAKKYTERIGNKMILEASNNQKSSNQTFDKKKILYEESNYKEAQDLSKKPNDSWGEAEINKREKEMIRKLKKFCEDNYFNEYL